MAGSRRVHTSNAFHQSLRKKKRCFMPLSFSSARVGPLVSFIGGLLALLSLVLPLDAFGMGYEVQGMVGQGTVDLVVVVVLLAALGVLSFSVAAFFSPRSPMLRGLGLLAASVGLFAQLNVVLIVAMNIGLTLENLPQLFSLLSQPGFLFAISWLPLLFLLSGWGITLGAPVGEPRGGVPPHRVSVSASASGEPSARETPTSRRRRGREPGIRELAEKQNPWRIGRRQIIAMIVGVLLYSMLSNLFLLWEGPGESNFEIIAPEVVLALFLGIASGPWVGLVTGGIGSILKTTLGTLAHLPLWILSNYALLNSPPLVVSRPLISWPFVVGNALVGFLAGLPLLGTPRRDMTVRSVLATTIRSALAVTLSSTLMVVLSESGQPGTHLLLAIQSNLTSTLLPTLLVALLLLPVLLALLPGGTRGKSEGEAVSDGAPGEPGEDSNSL
jgi:hypothetical protein